ncbi:enoyl-CoA hydratase-related protein [Actinomycetospora lutea]|uniref:enoyl-CoA hydratase-related protein n=1 Tax=Actinomycetospora lutea TaxID=663604 RepID=UPI00236588D9|nr:enoyl-CoA hydratase-related protein [Actinomycetospora lutea]MDD7938204.1 enoyl-CoA hydratase-related protein [Actinomycetospora lutea]
MSTETGSSSAARRVPDVRVERLDGVALLTVSDPKRRNAMTGALSERLVAVLAEVGADESVRAVVVTGDDDPKPAFCAGGDLDELAAAGEAGPDALEHIYAGFLALAECPLPTFAAVDGPAVGAGLNLALAADVRIAGDTARFEPGFLRLGVHPGGGMTWMAQRLVGPQVTTAMLLGGEGLDASRAAELGLVLRVATGEGSGRRSGDEAERSSTRRSAAVTEALRMAGIAAAAPRELVLATKATLRTTAQLDRHRDAVAVEVGPQLESLRSEGFREGLARVREATGKR